MLLQCRPYVLDHPADHRLLLFREIFFHIKTSDGLRYDGIRYSQCPFPPRLLGLDSGHLFLEKVEPCRIEVIAQILARPGNVLGGEIMLQDFDIRGIEKGVKGRKI